MKNIFKYILIAIPIILVLTSVTFYILKLPNQEKESKYLGLINQGNSQFEQKEYAKAINSYSEAAGILDTKSEAYEGIAKVLVAKNQLGQLVDVLDKSTQKIPTQSRALLYTQLADGYLRNNNPVQSEIYFNKALEFDNNSELAKLGLAKALISQGKLENINDKLNVNTESVNYEQAYILKLVTRLDNYDELKALVDENPTIVDTKQKGYQDDFKAVVKVAKTDTLYISALLSRIYVNMGYPNLAITLFEKQTDPNLMEYGDFVYVVAVANYNLGNYTKAIELLEQYNNSSGNPDVYLLLARSYSNTEETDKTNKYFDMAVAAAGDKSEEIYIEYVDHLLSTQQFVNALTIITKADKTLNENWLEIAYLRLYALEKNAKADSQIDKLQKNTTLTDTEKKDFYYWAITYYLESQKNNDATIYLAKLKELDKNNSKYYYLSGKLNLQLANPNEAKTDLEKAIDLDLEGELTESAKKLLSRVN